MNNNLISSYFLKCAAEGCVELEQNKNNTREAEYAKINIFILITETDYM